MSNLENVKKGDELLLSHFGTSEQIVTVDKVTAKYIILVNGRKFNKEDGRQLPIPYQMLCNGA